MMEEQWTGIRWPDCGYEVQVSSSGSYRHRLLAGAGFSAAHANGFAQVHVDDPWIAGLPETKVSAH